MDWCPTCKIWYDDGNETQPCCPSCGYPLEGAYDPSKYVFVDDDPEPELEYKLEPMADVSGVSKENWDYWCPFCDIPYDPDNESQPCCPECGYPLN